MIFKTAFCVNVFVLRAYLDAVYGFAIVTIAKKSANQIVNILNIKNLRQLINIKKVSNNKNPVKRIIFLFNIIENLQCYFNYNTFFY